MYKQIIIYIIIKYLKIGNLKILVLGLEEWWEAPLIECSKNSEFELDPSSRNDNLFSYEKH